jgi:hypothetical protein
MLLEDRWSEHRRLSPRVSPVAFGGRLFACGSARQAHPRFQLVRFVVLRRGRSLIRHWFVFLIEVPAGTIILSERAVAVGANVANIVLYGPGIAR